MREILTKQIGSRLIILMLIFQLYWNLSRNIYNLSNFLNFRRWTIESQNCNGIYGNLDNSYNDCTNQPATGTTLFTFNGGMDEFLSFTKSFDSFSWPGHFNGTLGASNSCSSRHSLCAESDTGVIQFFQINLTHLNELVRLMTKTINLAKLSRSNW